MKSAETLACEIMEQWPGNEVQSGREILANQIACAIRESVAQESRVLEVLIAAGLVSPEKVQEARRITNWK